MRKSRNIFAWLGMKEEKTVLEHSRQHLAKVLVTVEKLNDAIRALEKGDIPGKDKSIEEVKAAEREGDDLRRQMMKSLSEGLLLPLDRGDLMHFVKILDSIADWAKGAARLLEFCKTDILPPAFIKGLRENSDFIVEEAEKLNEATESLIKNDLEKALSDCSLVEELEEKADDKKRDLLGILLATDLAAPQLLLLFQIIEAVENVSDRIEDAADLIRILAVKSK